MITKICEICNKNFQAPQNSRRFCSKECAGRGHSILLKQKYYNNIPKEGNCAICGNKFIKKRHDAMFCSRKCSGINHSNLLEKRFKGKQPVWLKDKCFKKGMTSWNKGKKGFFPGLKTAFVKGHNLSPWGEKHPFWKGGKYKNKSGYVTLSLKGKKVLEHRNIMEQFLNRKLLPYEHVHHRNGIKNDNRIENLEILTLKTHMGKVTCPHCLKEFLIK